MPLGENSGRILYRNADIYQQIDTLLIWIVSFKDSNTLHYGLTLHFTITTAIFHV